MNKYIAKDGKISYHTYKYKIREEGDEIKYITALFNFIDTHRDILIWGDSGKYIIILEDRKFMTRFSKTDLYKFFKRVKFNENDLKLIEKYYGGTKLEKSLKNSCYSNPFFIKDKPHLLKYAVSEFADFVKVKNPMLENSEFTDFNKFTEIRPIIAQPVRLNLEKLEDSEEVVDHIKSLIPNLELDTNDPNELAYFDPSQASRMTNLPDYLFKKRKRID